MLEEGFFQSMAKLLFNGNKLQLQLKVSITMFKYTSLLSDSYRKETQPLYEHHQKSFSLCDSIKPTQNNTSNIQRQEYFQAPSDDPVNSLGKLNKQYQMLMTRQMPTKLTLQQFGPIKVSLDERLKNYPTRNKQQLNYNSVQNRLKALSGLSQRHEAALRQPDLQSKFKQISEKYSSKKEHLIRNPRGYQQQMNKKMQLTRQPVREGNNQRFSEAYSWQRANQLQNNYSFSKLPETPLSVIEQNKKSANACKQSLEQYSKQKQQYLRSPIQNQYYEPENDITRYSAKTMISDYLDQAKRDRNGYKQQELSYNPLPLSSSSRQNQTKYSHARTETSGREEVGNSMQKLSDLQSRINSSIKPYLNI